MQERGERATPVVIEKQLAAIERAAAAAAARAAVARAGGTSHYRCVDLRDGAAVERRRRRDPDAPRPHRRPPARRRARDQPLAPRQARRGVRPRLRRQDATAGSTCCTRSATMPLGATVAFGSIAGRFGNAGQTDYTAANDLLCKMAAPRSPQPARDPRLVIDWTAWAGHRHGQPRLDPEDDGRRRHRHAPRRGRHPDRRPRARAGTPRRDRRRRTRSASSADEADATGGLDPAPRRRARPARRQGRRMAARRRPHRRDHPRSRRRAVPPRPPDRRQGRPARRHGHRGVRRGRHAARCRAGASPPSRTWPSSRRSSSTGASRARSPSPPSSSRAGPRWSPSCRLTGLRTLADGEVQVTTHFTARVRLARQAPSPITDRLPAASRSPVGRDAVYRIYFHGPAYQVLASVARDGASHPRPPGRAAAPRPQPARPPSHRPGWSSSASRPRASGRSAPPAASACRPTSTGIAVLGAAGRRRAALRRGDAAPRRRLRRAHRGRGGPRLRHRRRLPDEHRSVRSRRRCERPWPRR